MYPTLSLFTLVTGLVITAFFFIYEATSSRKNRNLGMELATAALASVFLAQLEELEISSYSTPSSDALIPLTTINFVNISRF
ncbi:hypothetical protein Bca52824_012614 [Brassica carinata]|uniref:Dolichyl-diphosphooligosaccharide-protein glycosyltransferase subunit OST5 n=1 Tax=Brassica carinata TaxID=52824 RepID=A0A8X7VX58_BRACI|nr:hypothetical protein Bca52824_012614 [Brassica carinata]